MSIIKTIIPAVILMAAGIFSSCTKDREFKNYYGKSGIWEITEMKVDYYSDTTGVTVDSSKTYLNCGMFIFYNSDIGALREAFLGQYGITTTYETHSGFAWYPEDGKMYFTMSTATAPFRIYSVDGKGATQTWTYKGKNNSVLPGNAPYVSETISVNRIQAK